MNARKITADNLDAAIAKMRGEGFRLDMLYPADDPAIAVMSRGEEQVRVERPGAEHLPDRLADFVPEFILTNAGDSGGLGRAGMTYRDLVPTRLGGRYIASHIRIADDGPVADWVHYHQVLLQLIYVRRGWVRVVYEDQGPPFVMQAGDMVLQPAGIRHRVLDSGEGLEVIEISAPALHQTFAEHDLGLPNDQPTGRSYGKQRFLHHVAADTPWSPFGGGEAQESAMDNATGGIAQVRTIRGVDAEALSFEPTGGELVFGFVLEGTATLEAAETAVIAPADAFVIPPDQPWRISQPSPDFRLLHVTTARLDEAAGSLL